MVILQDNGEEASGRDSLTQGCGSIPNIQLPREVVHLGVLIQRGEDFDVDFRGRGHDLEKRGRWGGCCLDQDKLTNTVEC